MGKVTGFLEYERKVPQERDYRKRLSDWNEYERKLSESELQRQGARCMDCGTPFCHMGIQEGKTTFGCPLHNLIPEWNDLVYRGRWKEALDRLLKTNNFPEFTGRACPAPCEGSCTVALNDDAVTIKSIEKAIIDKGFENGWIVPNPPTDRTGKTVAVVGSGPAGLACADQLNKAGHSVTVYERDDRPGGLLMYGIPNMKLEKRHVFRRIQLLEEEGVRFVLGTEIGKDLSVQALKQSYDAVILATGATKPRDLNIEGRHLSGIHFAMEYLTQNTKSLLNSGLADKKYISAKEKNVIVIGGGDTGADCVATALRHGCRNVVQFGKYPALPQQRPDDNPWPEPPNVFTLDYAYAEAKAQFGRDPRQYAIQTKKFVGDDRGCVKELHTIQTEIKRTENGRPLIREIPGTEKVWPADLVLIAIGFSGPEEDVIKHFGIEQTEDGTVQAEYGKYTTNVDGVFACGDVRRGQSLIVWAIHEGREAARECDQYLMGSTVLP